MKILVILIIFVFALSLFRMILEWSKNNNKCSHQRYKRLENNDLYSEGSDCGGEQDSSSVTASGGYGYL